MREIWQGVIIGLVTGLSFSFTLFFLVFHFTEERAKMENLAATYAFHLFMTRSKWKAYYYTLFGVGK